MTEQEALQTANYLQNLHYFFSTAPQVLGAILAISGAFVVFKLDSLKKELFSGGSQQLINQEKNNPMQSNVFNLFRMGQIRRSQSAIDVNMLYSIIRKQRIVLDEMLLTKRTLKEELANKKNDKTTENFQKLTIEVARLEEIDDVCTFIENQSQSIRDFLRRTLRTYIVNGTVLAFLLGTFLFLPSSIFGNTYWIVLISGIVLSIFSLIWIICYLIKSTTFKIDGKANIED